MLAHIDGLFHAIPGPHHVANVPDEIQDLPDSAIQDPYQVYESNHILFCLANAV